ncbi:TIGR00282 family metallophosphoesterase [Candidatus Dependentiae bacterium]|nr:TIGR00282 family metallophosphoesterase [Candidatus Dependentiae bacterium]
MRSKTLRVMFLGDLAGPPGLAMFERWAPRLKEKHKIDMLVVNGENTAKNGRGISPEIVEQLQAAGAHVITSGNHVWANKKIYSLIDESKVLIRPANYPAGCPGKGYSIVEAGVSGVSVAVVNIQGRVFMHEDLDCPFRTIESLLTFLKSKTKLIFVEFHAEATSEKQAMRFFLDGKVTGLYCSHTHVQTADEMILPSGTSYITDLGFSGARYSALGVQSEIILERFLTQMPVLFKVEKKGPMVMNGIWAEVDVETGKTLHIERVNVIDGELVVE